jgi:hypothetical protein
VSPARHAQLAEESSGGQVRGSDLAGHESGDDRRAVLVEVRGVGGHGTLTNPSTHAVAWDRPAVVSPDEPLPITLRVVIADRACDQATAPELLR